MQRWLPAMRWFLRRGFAAALGLGLAGCASVGIGEMTASVATTTGGLFSRAPAGSPQHVQLFVASTRKNDGDATGALHYSLAQVSLPADHQAGVVEAPTFGKASAARHVVLLETRNLRPERFESELATHLSGRVGADRDVLVYVHGFHSGLDETRLRLAQIVADARFGGVAVMFTWPSQTSLLSYVSDKERATASRDALSEVLRNLAATPGVGRVHVLAHSLGAWLAMESLRENAIAGMPDLNGRLGEVMLAAPDIDLGVFRAQMSRLQGHARVSVLSSFNDRALNLSSRIAGDRPRVGGLDPRKPEEQAELERLGVKVYDIGSFSGGFIGHAVYANAPEVIRNIGARLAAPRANEAPAMADRVATEAAPDAGEAQTSPPRPNPQIVTNDLPPVAAAARQ